MPLQPLQPSGPHYQLQVLEDVVVIYDLNTGASAPSRIEGWLAEVDDTLGGLGDRPVIYRDINKMFDGVAHRDRHFIGYYPIGETVLELALRKVAVRGPRGS